VKLRPNAVVLVLDPRLLAHPPHHLVRVRDRRGEHEANRPSQVQRRSGQLVVPRQDRRLPWLADEHQGAAHRLNWPVEGRGNRLLQQPLAQPDPQLASGDAGDEPRLRRGCPAEEVGHPRDAGGGLGGLAHVPEGGIHLRQGQRLPGWHPPVEQLGGGIAEVGMAEVGIVQSLLIGAAGARQGLALLHPAEAKLVGAAGERAAREERGRDRHVA